ncbi:MAG: TetR/AcrR family transcriptional regulator [Myxococcota bacterium]
MAARRKPRQSRSRALVDAILEGAFRSAGRARRLREVSTKGIARQAGVSIGSLYQYFSDKDAVFGALIERELSAQVDRFEALLRDHDEDDMEQLVAAMIDEAVERYARTPALARLFIETIRLERVPQVAVARANIAAKFADALRQRGEFAEPLEPKIELLIHAIMGIFEARVLQPDAVPTEAFENLDVELTRLAVAYIHDLSS